MQESFPLFLYNSLLQDLSLAQLFTSFDQDVAAVGFQWLLHLAPSLAVEESTKFLLVAEACRAFVLGDEARRVVVGYRLVFVAEFPVAVAALEHRRDRGAQAIGPRRQRPLVRVHRLAGLELAARVCAVLVVLAIIWTE